jgi:hypothetical protein
MEIDKEKLKKFLAVTVSNFKMLETELLVYKTVFAAVGLSFNITQPLNQALEQGRNSATVKQLMDTKYDGSLATLLEGLDQAASAQEVLEFLNSWKPSGPPN